MLTLSYLQIPDLKGDRPFHFTPLGRHKPPERILKFFESDYKTNENYPGNDLLLQEIE